MHYVRNAGCYFISSKDKRDNKIVFKLKELSFKAKRVSSHRVNKNAQFTRN